MRLPAKHIEQIKNTVATAEPRAKVYLFGSRADDSAKGGDIDLLILTPGKLSGQTCRKIRIALYKSLGWQKIDLVNFTFSEEHPFKSLALGGAKLL